MSLFQRAFRRFSPFNSHSMAENVAQFIAAAKQAQPSLAGEGKTAGEISKLEAEAEALAKDLDGLDKKLTPLTYLVANTPSSADVSLYAHLHPSIFTASPDTFPSRPSVLRYFLQVQSLDPVVAAQKAMPNDFQPINIDVSSLPAPPRQVIAPVKKEKKAKAPAADAGKAAEAAAPAAAAAAAGSEAAPEGKKKEKKEKKEKAPKAQPAKAEPSAPLPSMIDMRVGKVLDGELLLSPFAPLAPRSPQSSATPMPTRCTSSRLTWERPSHAQSAQVWSST